MFNTRKWSYLMGITALLAVGCAKDKPFEAVYKGENLFTKEAGKSKSLPCVNEVCLYVPSVVEAPRTVRASRPYWMGSEKLVKLKINESSVDIMQVEKDGRFSDNPTNTHQVLAIAATHHDYRCAENDNGECGNKEEENTEITWDQKKFVRLNFNQKTHVKELNFLPEQLDMYFDGCYVPTDARLVKTEVDPQGMNIIAEQDFMVTANCLDKIDTLGDVNFTVKYHYSLRSLKSLSSSDYKTVFYGKQDDNSFGFFTTQEAYLTADHRDTLDTDRVYLNRWNPDRKEIPYYLSESFYKPELAHIKRYTEEAVKTVNKSFEQAGVDLKITLKDGRGKDSGDIRNNMIVLVEDPQATGVIGYGPSVTNPYTGEIIHARTVMYYGTMVKFIQGAYDDLRDEQLAKKAAEEREAAGTPIPSNGPEVAERIARAQTIRELVDNLRVKKYGTSLRQEHQNLARRTSFDKDRLLNQIHKFSLEKVKEASFNKNNKIDIKHYIKNYKLLTEEEKKASFYEVLSAHNAYHADMFDFEGAAVGSLTAGMLSDYMEEGILKKWTSLSNEDKKDIVAKIMPYTWVPTLVHELGHNLGLRHNFNGSEDKANYYSKMELAQMGLEREVTYSSVMDYSHNNLNELPVMGKYDVAAIRFGYARKVETTTGQLAKVEDTLELLGKPDEANKDPLRLTEALLNAQGKSRKDYQYCTDEHVSVNAGCNRFDEGDNIKDISQHWVNQLNSFYRKRHFREDKKDFSEFDDISVENRVFFYNRSLRLFFETFDRLSNMFFGEATEEGMNYAVQVFRGRGDNDTADFLQNVIDATKVAGDYYMSVLMTPDVHCAIAKADTPEAIVEYTPIAEIDDRAVDCFDEDVQSSLLREGKMAIGQTGKFNSNKKDPNATHIYTPYTTEIDIRGTWLEKKEAFKFLTRRKLHTSIFDDITGSFLDLTSYRQKFFGYLVGLIQDDLTTQTEVTMINGEKKLEKVNFKPSTSNELRGYGYNALNRYFGLTTGKNILFEKLLDESHSRILDGASYDFQDMFRPIFSYHKDLPNHADPKDFVKATIGGKTFLASKENQIAGMVIENHTIVKNLDALKPEVIQAIIDGTGAPTQADINDILNQNGEGDATVVELPDTAEVRFAQKLDKEILQAYLAGKLPTTEHSANILNSLRVMNN